MSNRAAHPARRGDSKAERPWYVIAGGGTGGHLYPGLAVAEALQRAHPDSDVTVFGTTRAIDRRLVAPRGYELVEQPVRPFTFRPWKWPGFLFAWRAAVTQARGRFEGRRPALVLGLGGYAAGPAIVAAADMGIPTAIFNPDAEPGRANRHLASKVDCVYVQWEATAARFATARRVVCTGCPVRPEFASWAPGAVSTTDRRVAARRTLGLDPARRVVLVTGASQGARSINRAMLELADLWRARADWRVVHLTGEPDYDNCREFYARRSVDAHVVAYTEQMALHMASADLVISRAGASTLAEITAMGLPSVLLPYPYDRRQHQSANARVLVEAGAAVLVDDAADPETNAARLRPVLDDLLADDERRAALSAASARIGRTDAAERMAAELLQLVARDVKIP